MDDLRFQRLIRGPHIGRYLLLNFLNTEIFDRQEKSRIGYYSALEQVFASRELITLELKKAVLLHKILATPTVLLPLSKAQFSELMRWHT